MQRMLITVGLIFATIPGSEFVSPLANQSEKVLCSQCLNRGQLGSQKKLIINQSIPNVPDKTYAFASLNHSLDSNSTESESFESIQSSSTQSVYQENSEEALSNSQITAVFVLRNNHWFAMNVKQAQIDYSQSQCGIVFKSVDIGNTIYTYAYIVPKD